MLGLRRGIRSLLCTTEVQPVYAKAETWYTIFTVIEVQPVYARAEFTKLLTVTVAKFNLIRQDGRAKV